MPLQSETARDKQIATFGRRDRVVKAAIMVAQLHGRAGQAEAVERLVAAVKEYKPAALTDQLSTESRK